MQSSEKLKFCVLREIIEIRTNRQVRVAPKTEKEIQIGISTGRRIVTTTEKETGKEIETEIGIETEKGTGTETIDGIEGLRKREGDQITSVL